MDTVLTLVTVVSQRAMSVELGACPPTQLVVRLRFTALLALRTVAAGEVASDSSKRMLATSDPKADSKARRTGLKSV
jgi:hypothetical protein